MDDTLSAVVGFSSTGAIKVGLPAVDGAATSSGFFISANGIVATKAGVATLSISGTGDASFKGSIAATGGIYGGYYENAHTWPGAGAGGGYSLNDGGLLLGNYNSYIAAKNAGTSLVGKGFFQIDSGTGFISAPQFYIQDGVARFLGNLEVGATVPVISGATIGSGAGALIKSDGSFALGGTTSNIVGSGSSITLNGPIVQNGNIADLAVTTVKIVVGAVSGNYSNNTTTTQNTNNTPSSVNQWAGYIFNLPLTEGAPVAINATCRFDITWNSTGAVPSPAVHYLNVVAQYAFVRAGYTTRYTTSSIGEFLAHSQHASGSWNQAVLVPLTSITTTPSSAVYDYTGNYDIFLIFAVYFMDVNRNSINVGQSNVTVYAVSSASEFKV